MKVGFSGGLVVDYPHSTRAKKYFLVLMVRGREAPWRRRRAVTMPSREPRSLQRTRTHSPRGGAACLALARLPSPAPLHAPRWMQVGGHAPVPTPRGMDGGEPSDDEEGRQEVRVGQRRTKRQKSGKPGKGSRDWIVRKKAQQRSRGYEDIKPDSKYTGRKRKSRF